MVVLWAAGTRMAHAAAATHTENRPRNNGHKLVSVAGYVTWSQADVLYTPQSRRSRHRPCFPQHLKHRATKMSTAWSTPGTHGNTHS